ncbi:hypothetical protein C6K10_004421 [Salmonella enterica subsp. enterica serovar Enteritidis]|nr:hypothetical protein [Salmonella enterica subsp. enterica serovar Enteritidis]
MFFCCVSCCSALVNALRAVLSDSVTELSLFRASEMALSFRVCCPSRRACCASSRQPGGCGLSWSEITVIKTDNIIVFQLVIWPVQLNPVNENLPLKEANFPAMS